jgi:DNA-binding response OmpR family regulator
MSETKPLAVIVEDEEYLADIYSQTLEGAGFETKILRDGDTAILYLARTRPALVLLDLNLPRYSGANIYTYIGSEERLRDTWIVIATADASLSADFRRLEQQDDKLVVLVKPVSVEQLHNLACRLVFGSTLP